MSHEYDKFRVRVIYTERDPTGMVGCDFETDREEFYEFPGMVFKNPLMAGDFVETPEVYLGKITSVSHSGVPKGSGLSYDLCSSIVRTVRFVNESKGLEEKFLEEGGIV